MPSFSSARSIGSSIMSMPTGSFSIPKCASAFLICLAKSPWIFIQGGSAPCMVLIGAATLSAIQGDEMRLAGAAGSHRNGGASAGQCAYRMKFSRGSFAHMGAGGVWDLVAVGSDDRAQAGMTDRFLRALQAFLEQAVVVDTLLPVLGHGAPGRGRLRSVVFHRGSLRGPDGRRI